MPTASIAQRALITAVADAIAVAGDAPVTLGAALIAAELVHNPRTRDACLRSGWLNVVSDAPRHYWVSPAGYRQIDRPQDTGLTRLPDDPHEARAHVERLAVRGAFVQYLGMFHGWRTARLRVGIVTKMGQAGIAGDRVLVGVDPIWNWTGTACGSFWSVRNGIKTGISAGEYVFDEAPEGACAGCGSATVAGVRWPAVPERAPLRETFEGRYRALACTACDRVPDDEAAAHALAAHLRGHRQEVEVRFDGTGGWWVVLRALSDWPPLYRDRVAVRG